MFPLLARGRTLTRFLREIIERPVDHHSAFVSESDPDSSLHTSITCVVVKPRRPA